MFNEELEALCLKILAGFRKFLRVIRYGAEKLRDLFLIEPGAEGVGLIFARLHHAGVELPFVMLTVSQIFRGNKPP